MLRAVVDAVTQIVLAALTMALVAGSLNAQTDRSTYSREQRDVVAVDDAIQKAVLAGDVAVLESEGCCARSRTGERSRVVAIRQSSRLLAGKRAFAMDDHSTAGHI